jgi:hypothetical protein
MFRAATPSQGCPQGHPVFHRSEETAQMLEIGAGLRAAREKRGLTAEDVHRSRLGLLGSS